MLNIQQNTKEFLEYCALNIYIICFIEISFLDFSNQFLICFLFCFIIGNFRTAGTGCWIKIVSCPADHTLESFFYDAWGATNVDSGN